MACYLGTDFSNANLENARFDFAQIEGANFTGANLKGLPSLNVIKRSINLAQNR